MKHAETEQHPGPLVGALWMLAVLTVINICNALDRTLISILLPDVKAELALTDWELGMVTGPAFAIFYSLMGLQLGWLAERVNRTRMIAIALTTWSAMTALTGAARSFLHLMILRVAVAIGEAGGSPPSYAMITDAFPLKSRSTAMAVFTSAGALGGFFGLLLGGWINEFWGWRITFYAAGAGGMVLVPLILFTVKDPGRGQADGLAKPASPIPMLEAMPYLFRARTFRHLVLAGAMSAFASYAFAIWQPSFMHRSYGMSSGEIGTVLAIVNLVGGLTGTMVGGELARRLGERDLRWWLWIPAIGFLGSVPLNLWVILTHNLDLTIALLVLAHLGVGTYTGTLWASANSIAPSGMRSITSSSLLFVQITLGLGLGPLLTGWASDWMTGRFGDEGLRYAMIVPILATVVGGTHYLLASRTLRSDAQAAIDEMTRRSIPSGARK